MDPVTHSFAGAALANAFFRRSLGSTAVPLLVVASNWTDLDVVFHFTGLPDAIALRRTFGHSFLTLPFLLAVLALLFRWRRPEHGFGSIFRAAAAGAALHLLFDLINSFGVVLLWPATPWRAELATNFILDPILTGILVLAFIAGALRKDSRESAARWGLAAAAFYLVFCAANRASAAALLLRQPGAERAAFSYVFPEPFGPHRWRGVLGTGSGYQVYLLKSLSREARLRADVASADSHPAVEKVRASEAARRLMGFFKAPVWSARTEAGGTVVDVYDLRFRSLLVDRGGAFHFSFFVPDAGEPALLAREASRD